MVVLFDFDGVVNKAPYFSEAYEKDFGVPEEDISLFFHRDFEQCAKGEADIQKLLQPYLEKWQWKQSTEAFLAYWFTHDIKLDAELLRVVEHIKRQGHYVALASQQEIRRKTHIWETLALNNVFHKFYCTCDMRLLKTTPAFYVKLLEDLKAQHTITWPHEVIFFDDTTSCIDAAKQAGIESYRVQSNEQLLRHLKSRLQRYGKPQ